MHLEAAKAERPLPNHGDDRVVLIPELGRFALFDGAGQSFASDIAADTFRQVHDGADSALLPGLRDTFGLIQARILDFRANLSKQHRVASRYILTTGTAVGIQAPVGDETALRLGYAHTGDSSLWMFDHDSGNLSKLTRDDAIGAPGNCIPNTHNWLGSTRHRLRQCSGLFLDASHVTLSLFSDGVGSRDEISEGGITPGTLHRILGSPIEPQEKANQIIEASRINDDRSVIVVEAWQ